MSEISCDKITYTVMKASEHDCKCELGDGL